MRTTRLRTTIATLAAAFLVSLGAGSVAPTNADASMMKAGEPTSKCARSSSPTATTTTTTASGVSNCRKQLVCRNGVCRYRWICY